MSLQHLKLSLMVFPQRWDDTSQPSNRPNLELRLLLLPAGDPLHQNLTPSGPPFAGTQLHLQAAIIPGLDDLPTPGAAGTTFFPITTPVPSDAVALFNQLPGANQVVSSPTKSLSSDLQVKKALPQSYIDAFSFEQARRPFIVGEDEFACSVRAKQPGTPSDPAPPKTTTWGQLLSFALRQPVLARALGLLYDVPIKVDPLTLVKDGGWVYITLDESDSNFPYVTDWLANRDLIKRYAARLPPLASGTTRALFAPVLFPVVTASSGSYDEVIVEAEGYDDGFAKIVHCSQPATADAATGNQSQVTPATDAGIQLGWDDEQVAIWQNRQLDLARDRLNNTTLAAEAPLGVCGYCVDVRPQGDSQWHSLCHVTGTINYGPLQTTINVDAAIEPTPIRSADPADSEAWLPRYFAQWRGKSLAVNDTTVNQLTGGSTQTASSFLTPVLPAGVHLLYSNQYAFRTRLVDLTGGGPGTQDKPINPAAANVAQCRFQRFIPPKAVRIETTPPAPGVANTPPPVRPIDKISVWRPLLGYPEFTFAGVLDQQVIDQLISLAPTAWQNNIVLGVNDPGVETLQIVVEVRAPAHDTGTPGEQPGDLDGPFRVAYRLQRKFPPLPANPLDRGQPLDLLLDFRDIHTIEELQTLSTGENDPLPIPRARDVRIRLTPIGHNVPHYWGNDAARVGLTTDLTTRKDALSEQDLYVQSSEAKELNAILLQPSDDMALRLGQQLGLEVRGLTFSAPPGKRMVFGASKALRHTLAGDHSTITFAAQSELLHHWVVAMSLDLNRDWTWDSLAPGFTIERDGNAVGTLEMRQTVSASAVAGATIERNVTHLIFFDAVDPSAWTNSQGFPVTPAPVWRVTPQFQGGASNTASVKTLSVTLPIAVLPRQTPKIVSAGIALSPYQRAPDYSSTEPRRRVLWLEFEEPVLDANDAYFARVLAYGPDPLLAGSILQSLEASTGPRLSNPTLPPLPVDPEPIRVITPGQPADRAGLDAMVELIPSQTAASTNRYFMLPLPPGISANALELFGFWTYELRVGHKNWSTAQARFGRPLQVSGVQHPAPVLQCQVGRQLAEIVDLPPAEILATRPARIVVTAPYATPVFNGQNFSDLRWGDPQTQIWVLLYAQVVQADGQEHRNVLLTQKLAQLTTPLTRQQQRGTGRDLFGEALFDEREIQAILWELALPLDSPLSVLAVELLAHATTDRQRGFADPLRTNLGQVRILRTSPLTPVPATC